MLVYRIGLQVGKTNFKQFSSLCVFIKRAILVSPLNERKQGILYNLQYICYSPYRRDYISNFTRDATLPFYNCTYISIENR